MKRLAITFFYDEDGIVDEYMFYLLSSLKDFVDRNIFVSNGKIGESAVRRLNDLKVELLERENVGFDVWAYKAGIEKVGYENLREYDEILLLNHTFYGPIFPFSEMFGEMENRQCDFWGITAHKEMIPNPFTNDGVLPRHLNSHFIAVRSPLLHSEVFSDYWRHVPEINTYVDSVLLHESQFTRFFINLGYICSVYDDDNAYPSKYPCFINVDLSMERRCPILKRRLFFQDPVFMEQNAIDLPRALNTMRRTSNYDENMIWKNILRATTSRTLNTNAALTRVLPAQRASILAKTASLQRIAVCAHIYYLDLLDEMLEFVSNISVPFDLIITTDSASKKSEIERRIASLSGLGRSYVLAVEQNRGRDMSAMFIACREFFLDDRYDLVCRLHTKKTPQVEGGRGLLFKRHMLENLIGTPGLVDGVLELFDKSPRIGLVVPPVVHISYPTMGNAWFANKPRALEVAKILNLRVKFDASTPVAPYGGMYWFRPKALRKLFEYRWSWEDFDAEPHYGDGDLSHALERLIGYTAQDAGYLTMQVLSEEQAALNYSMLEFKLEHMASFMPWNLPWQFHMLEKWKKAGYPIEPVSEMQRKGFAKFLRSEEYYDENASNRIIRENYRVLGSITGAETPSNDDRLNAAYVRFLQDLRVEQIRSMCGSRNPLLNLINGKLKIGSSDAEIVRDNVRHLNVFLDITRCKPRNRVEMGVRDREIIDYLFFSWHDENELCALFDSRYYASRYLQIETAFNPFVHYLTIGARKQFDPHPLFDCRYYLDQVCGRTVENPLIDYLTIGWKDGLSPHPLFESSYYLENNPDVAAQGVEPLTHYLTYGGVEGRNPHWAFDTRYYLQENPGVEAGGVNPLLHFVMHGVREGCRPNKQFDVHSYLEHHPELKRSGVNPLVHYVTEVRVRLKTILQLP